jgi:hypothetical protein
MVVKRNNAIMHTANLSYRVCSLCSSVSRRVTLDVACSCTTAITSVSQLVIHQQQPESQLAPPSRRTRSGSNPAEGEWLTSHSCGAGLSIALAWHPHIARCHTTTCQQLPAPQREYTPRLSFRRAGFAPLLGVG